MLRIKLNRMHENKKRNEKKGIKRGVYSQYIYSEPRASSRFLYLSITLRLFTLFFAFAATKVFAFALGFLV